MGVENGWAKVRCCVRALVFYGVFLAVAIVWRVGFQGESLLLASAADRVQWLRDLLLGLGAGTS